METIKFILIGIQLVREILNLVRNHEGEKKARLQNLAQFKDELRKVRVGDEKDTSAVESKFRMVLNPGMSDDEK